VKERFETEVLPVIRVRERSEGDCEAGIQCMPEALQRRIDIKAIFEGEALARELVKMSGGGVRDLIHLTQEALLASQVRVNQQAMERAIRTVRSEFSREIGAEEYRLLAWLHLNKTVANDAEHWELLFRRDVLEYKYTEDRWADVHPLVLGMREFQDALMEQKRKIRLG
jgi:hypothetical protein